jgi:hypothetical protein
LPDYDTLTSPIIGETNIGETSIGTKRQPTIAIVDVEASTAGGLTVLRSLSKRRSARTSDRERTLRSFRQHFEMFALCSRDHPPYLSSFHIRITGCGFAVGRKFDENLAKIRRKLDESLYR